MAEASLLLHVRCPLVSESGAHCSLSLSLSALLLLSTGAPAPWPPSSAPKISTPYLPLSSAATMGDEVERARGAFRRRHPPVKARSAAAPHAPADNDESTKLVYFVRHGQGFHNLVGEVARGFGADFSDEGDYEAAISERCPYLHPGIQDPPLTQIGREEAERLRPQFSDVSPELIVSSPLRRATQTALIGLSEKLSSPLAPPVMAHEDCREQFGVYLSDKRSSVSSLSYEFPTVNYDLMQDGEDNAWSSMARERLEGTSMRAESFLHWLRERPETVIVVSSHSAWLMATFNIVLDVDEQDAEILKAEFSTGEVRQVLLTF